MGKTLRFFSLEQTTRVRTQKPEPLLEIEYELSSGDRGIEYLSPLEAKEFKRDILFSGGRILSQVRVL